MLPSIFGETLFDDFFDGTLERRFLGDHSPLYGKHAKNLMKTDVRELNDCYDVAIDLPGFKKEDLKVDWKDGYLTVSAVKRLDRDEKDAQGRYIRQERYSGSCSRSFYVGDMKPENVKAKYEDGILHLTMPKNELKALPNKNQIEIE